MEVNVLMVDDHPPIIEGYKSILSLNNQGYKLITTTAYSCESAYNTITSANHSFDIVFLDVTLPPFKEKNIHSGEDLIPVVKKYHPKSKIIVLTSHSESIVLYKLMNEHNPQGFLIKSDFQSEEFITAFDTILKGGIYYSATVVFHQKNWEEKNKVMDNYNRQILLLLSQGVKTKSIPDLLNLSISAINKRKAILKQIFGIDKGTDEDILKEARKQGYL
jgi:DNA-binding NarL/FixJ family response regulator